MVSELSADVTALLVRARCGTIQDFDSNHAEEASIQWHADQPLPTCLRLRDLDAGPSLPDGFGSHPARLCQRYRARSEREQAVHALPHDMFTNLGQLRVLFLGGPGPKITPEGTLCNMLTTVPSSLSRLVHLEHLSLHDNNLTCLPDLHRCTKLRTLRLDRNPIRALPDLLPQSLQVLHLEGCPLGGTLAHPEDLPAQVRALTQLEDLLMPDGCHVGKFFGTPLGRLLLLANTNAP